MKNHQTERWLNERVFNQADDFFEALLEELGAARTSIDLEMYIFDADGLGGRIAGALAEAARRGVAVRILVDAVGSPDWPGRAGRLLENTGVEMRVYHPVPWSLPGLRWLWKKPGVFMQILRNMNRRDHRKVVIIDRKAAWLGSMNVSDRSLRSVKGPAAWHECGVRVEGDEVSVLTHAFEYAWDRVRDPLARFTNRALQYRRVTAFRTARLVRVNAPYKLRRRNLRELLQKIRSARRRVWIETPYFIPTPRLLTALCVAAYAGADVRLILPSRSDIFFMPWIVPSFLSRLVRGGHSVFEYVPTTLHSKIMMIDDWAIVGSSNLNHRSLFHDLEVDAVISSPGGLQALEDRFLADMKHSIEVSAETLRMRPLIHKLLGRIVMPLRFWM